MAIKNLQIAVPLEAILKFRHYTNQTQSIVNINLNLDSNRLGINDIRNINFLDKNYIENIVIDAVRGTGDKGLLFKQSDVTEHYGAFILYYFFENSLLVLLTYNHPV